MRPYRFRLHRSDEARHFPARAPAFLRGAPEAGQAIAKNDGAVSPPYGENDSSAARPNWRVCQTPRRSSRPIAKRAVLPRARHSREGAFALPHTGSGGRLIPPKRKRQGAHAPCLNFCFQARFNYPLCRRLFLGLVDRLRRVNPDVLVLPFVEVEVFRLVLPALERQRHFFRLERVGDRVGKALEDKPLVCGW